MLSSTPEHEAPVAENSKDAGRVSKSYTLLKVEEKKGVANEQDIVRIPVVSGLLCFVGCTRRCVFREYGLSKFTDLVVVRPPKAKLSPLGDAFDFPVTKVSDNFRDRYTKHTLQDAESVLLRNVE